MGLWARIKQRWTTAHEHPPTPSLVMLLLKPHFLDAPMLARLASRALAQSMRADDIAQRRVAEHWQVFVFDRGELRFAVHNAARRYIDLDQLQAARPRDPQVDQAIHDHLAWLSVDVLSDNPAEKHWKRSRCWASWQRRWR